MLPGICLTATSISITADTLREMGRLGSDTAKAIIGAAALCGIGINECADYIGGASRTENVAACF